MSTGKYRYIPPQPPLWFSMAVPAGLAAIVGLLSAQGDTALMLPGMVVAAIIAAIISAVLIRLNLTRFKAGIIFAALMVVFGIATLLSPLVSYLVIWLYSCRMAIWLMLAITGWLYRLMRPRAKCLVLPVRVICGLVFVFLITPILILIPLSFNQEPYFSFTKLHSLNLKPIPYAGIVTFSIMAWLLHY